MIVSVSALLDDYLNLIESGVYNDIWFDVLCDDAEKLASMFDPKDWEALAERVVSLAPLSQEKCLYTICGGNPIWGFKIGLLLVGSENADIHYRALETMADCLQSTKATKDDLDTLRSLEKKISITPAAERFWLPIAQKVKDLS